MARDGERKDADTVQLPGDVHKRLTDIGAEVRELRRELDVLDEQVAYARELADEATTRELVSQTPLAARERRGAVEDLRRTQRQRDEVAERLGRLHGERDDLLERLLPGGGPA